jgi:hypothetical protein
MDYNFNVDLRELALIIFYSQLHLLIGNWLTGANICGGPSGGGVGCPLRILLSLGSPNTFCRDHMSPASLSQPGEKFMPLYGSQILVSRKKA